MEVGKLTVKRRHQSGKGTARKLRAQGHIPGICYGAKLEQPIAVSVNPKALKSCLDPIKRRNTVIDLTIEDEREAPANVTVMVLDFQIDKIRRELTHVDLVAIDTNKVVDVDIPLEFTGKAKGLVSGGQLHVESRRVDIRCKPADIPGKLVVDISDLDVNDVIHVGDLELSEGVEMITPQHLAVITCSAAEAEETAAEGEEGEEAAAAAAPAGDKAEG